MTKHTIFLGLNDKDTKQQEIDTISCYKLAQRIMSNNGISAYTLSEANGVYTHDDGTITIEKTLQFIILGQNKQVINDIITDLKTTFNQESVLLTTERVNTEFI